MNAEAIYEWLHPKLKGQDWTLEVNRFFPEKGRLWAKRAKNKYGFHPAHWVPPLDMNTAFSEAIPKLKAEGIDSFFSSWRGWTLETDTDSWENPDFYSTLTEYLEAKA